MDANYFVSTLVGGGEPPLTDAFADYFAAVESRHRPPLEVAAVLAALSARPTDARLIVPFIRFLENGAPPKVLADAMKAINIVGTGGGLSTFNISTTAAFVAAAAGAVVLKTGSAAYSSHCGSHDVLSRLGLGVPMDDAMLQAMLAEVGVGFVHPSRHAPFLRRLAVTVQPLELRHIGQFINRCGPFLRPFHVHGQLTGVGRRQDLEVFAAAMSDLGRVNVMLVHAQLGMDELASVGTNHCCHIGLDGKHRSWTELGLHPARPGSNLDWLIGGGPEENAVKLMAILRGDGAPMARDTVALNAAATLKLAGVAGSLAEGIEMAHATLRNGRAFAKLEAAMAFYRRYSRPAAAAKAA